MKINKVLFTIVFSSAILLCTACGGNTEISFKNVAIDDFSGYASLGAGVTNAGASARNFPANAAFAAEESNGETVLLGVKEDDSIEQVTLTREGERLTQQLYLPSFLGGNVFHAVSYSSYPASSLFPINQSESTTCFIDNKTGKYYPLPKDLGNHAAKFIGLHVKDPSLDQQYQTDAAFYEYENTVLFAAKTSESNSDFYTYYSAKVVGGELEIKERIKSSSLPGNDFCFADRYGNMYFTDAVRQNFDPRLKKDTVDYPITAILTAGGKLTRPENKPAMFLSLNGIAYVSDLSRCANAEGSLVENSLQTCGLTLHPNTLLFTKGNVSYYFDSTRYELKEEWDHAQEQGNYTYTYSIYKVTRSNDTEFTYEKIPFLESSESLNDDSGVFKYQYAAAGEKFFYLRNDSVVEVNPDTGENTARTFDFVFQFNTIEGDALGNIYYTGINSSAKQVTGILFPDGRYTENVSEVPSRVSYIQPIN